MEAKELLRVLHTAERLKDETRHCYTSGGRRESVAEHSWRLALTALFLRDEFPALDMDRVIRMCLIHDLGECFTGDIPSFLKSGGDEERERSALETWVASLPAPYSVELKTLYAEMDALETDEARLYKALDKLEAVIQHNESDIATWLPREYELNLTYADENVAFPTISSGCARRSVGRRGTRSRRQNTTDNERGAFIWQERYMKWKTTRCSPRSSARRQMPRRSWSRRRACTAGRSW